MDKEVDFLQTVICNYVLKCYCFECMLPGNLLNPFLKLRGGSISMSLIKFSAASKPWNVHTVLHVNPMFEKVILKPTLRYPMIWTERKHLLSIPSPYSVIHILLYRDSKGVPIRFEKIVDAVLATTVYASGARSDHTHTAIEQGLRVSYALLKSIDLFYRSGFYRGK